MNNHLRTSIERVKQLENQRRMKERRDEITRKKMEARRHIKFGKLVCKYLPVEDFVSFENLLRLLTGDAELFAKLKEEAAKYVLQG